ncbi:MAG: transglutaminase-like cysteine peptidase [Betaproteobacteria bacterium]
MHSCAARPVSEPAIRTGLRGRRGAALVVALVLAALSGQAIPQGLVEPGYTTAATERLILAYEKRFGTPVRGRVEAWKRFAQERRGEALRELALVAAVNAFLNRIRFVDDLAHWGEDDYWATPAEAVGSGGADCEDYTIAKYFLLRELGVPVARLRMVYVRAVRLNQAHMVLAYYARPDADPLVLDNLEQEVRPASQRPDLVPVYSFNDEALWVETHGRVGAPQQIRNWAGLRERLERELLLAGLARGAR